MLYATKKEALRRQAEYDKHFADFCLHDLQQKGIAHPRLRAISINYYLQATEKVLKAMAAEVGEPVRNTHNVIEDLLERGTGSKARIVLRQQIPTVLITQFRVFQGLTPQRDDETAANVEYPFGSGRTWRIPAEHFDERKVKEASRVCGRLFSVMDKYLKARWVNRLGLIIGDPVSLREELRQNLIPGGN
jgi:hypothetical protein